MRWQCQPLSHCHPYLLHTVIKLLWLTESTPFCHSNSKNIRILAVRTRGCSACKLKHCTVWAFQDCKCLRVFLCACNMLMYVSLLEETTCSQPVCINEKWNIKVTVWLVHKPPKFSVKWKCHLAITVPVYLNLVGCIYACQHAFVIANLPTNCIYICQKTVYTGTCLLWSWDWAKGHWCENFLAMSVDFHTSL